MYHGLEDLEPPHKLRIRFAKDAPSSSLTAPNSPVGWRVLSHFVVTREFKR